MSRKHPRALALLFGLITIAPVPAQNPAPAPRPGKLAEHEGHSEALQDLQVEAPDAGFRTLDDPADDSWKHSSDPAVIVAGRHLERAEARASEARRVYGQMMENNYPRGAARERIVGVGKRCLGRLRSSSSNSTRSSWSILLAGQKPTTALALMSFLLTISLSMACASMNSDVATSPTTSSSNISGYLPANSQVTKKGVQSI